MSVHQEVVGARVSAVHALARIDRNEALDGGLFGPMPSPCRSLLLRVDRGTAEDDEMNLGVQVTTASGEPLSPGAAAVTVDLHFWSDLAAVFVVPSTRFIVRYPNRVVGRGQVLEVLPFSRTLMPRSALRR